MTIGTYAMHLNVQHMILLPSNALLFQLPQTANWLQALHLRWTQAAPSEVHKLRTRKYYKQVKVQSSMQITDKQNTCISTLHKRGIGICCATTWDEMSSQTPSEAMIMYWSSGWKVCMLTSGLCVTPTSTAILSPKAREQASPGDQAYCRYTLKGPTGSFVLSAYHSIKYLSCVITGGVLDPMDGPTVGIL